MAVELLMSKNPTKLWFIILLQKHALHAAQKIFVAAVRAPEQSRRFYIKTALEIIFSLSFWNFCIKSPEKGKHIGTELITLLMQFSELWMLSIVQLENTYAKPQKCNR